MKINSPKIFLKPVFIAYLAIILGQLSGAYAQTPVPGRCDHTAVNGVWPETNSPFIRQDLRDSPHGFSPAPNRYRYNCGTRATIDINPGALMSTHNSLRTILSQIGDSNIETWTTRPKYDLVVTIYDPQGRPTLLLDYNLVDNKKNISTRDVFSTSVAGWHEIEFKSRGVIASDGRTELGLERASGVIDLGRGNLISYAPRYDSVPDPCRFAFKVGVAPSRINLGSQTIKNFGENVTRKANFSITASRRHYAGCGTTAEPILTLIPDGNNIDNLGIMKLNNGTEILVEDDSGAPVIFNRATSMGGRLEMGSHVGAMSRIVKSYRLTWRRIPGEQLVTGKFQKILRANVEFR